jgi:predicted transcriptional regulator
MIEAANPSVEERKLKGVYMLKTGLTLTKIEEYLRDLEATGLVERDGDGVRYVG